MNLLGEALMKDNLKAAAAADSAIISFPFIPLEGVHLQAFDTKTTQAEIHELLEKARKERLSSRLAYIYNQIPANDCQRCGDCCFNCAQVYPTEFLNVYDHILSLNELAQARLAERLIEYELLNLVTLEVKCPFLEGVDCVLYERRPFQCRTFGLYATDEYQNMVDDSREKNKQLAKDYARNNRLQLSQEVMTYDVDQCENNFDKEGGLVILGRPERERFHEQIFACGDDMLSDDWSSSDQVCFSTQFALLLYDEKSLDDLRIKIMREFQSGGKRTTLDKVLTSSGLKF